VVVSDNLLWCVRIIKSPIFFTCTLGLKLLTGTFFFFSWSGFFVGNNDVSNWNLIIFLSLLAFWLRRSRVSIALRFLSLIFANFFAIFGCFCQQLLSDHKLLNQVHLNLVNLEARVAEILLNGSKSLALAQYKVLGQLTLCGILECSLRLSLYHGRK